MNLNGNQPSDIPLSESDLYGLQLYKEALLSRLPWFPGECSWNIALLTSGYRAGRMERELPARYTLLAGDIFYPTSPSLTCRRVWPLPSASCPKRLLLALRAGAVFRIRF
ncbi:hypothetical protein HPP92_007742 [Vanilla planifolia]|uniref:Uncharacterized protein n=1 Tax=Vanilla planifolia TaxID=51239 RepID=A0A835RAS3_VANPL|nr:hypothetical protein HPP92_007742 [Vanilla planifolia]